MKIPNKTKLSLILTLLITLPLKLNQIHKLFMIQKSNFSASPEVHFLWCEVVLGMLQEFHMKKRRRVYMKEEGFLLFFRKNIRQNCLSTRHPTILWGSLYWFSNNVDYKRLATKHWCFFIWNWPTCLLLENKQLYFRGLIFKGLRFERLV